MLCYYTKYHGCQNTGLTEPSCRATNPAHAETLPKSTNSKFIHAVLETVNFLNVNSLPKDIQDVCFCAAFLGPLPMIFRDLGRNGKVEVSHIPPSNHTLAAAAYFGDEALVEKLLQDGDAVVDRTSIIGNPITLAAAQGHSRILFLLLNAGT